MSCRHRVPEFVAPFVILCYVPLILGLVLSISILCTYTYSIVGSVLVPLVLVFRKYSLFNMYTTYWLYVITDLSPDRDSIVYFEITCFAQIKGTLQNITSMCVINICVLLLVFTRNFEEAWFHSYYGIIESSSSVVVVS
jgi:hypothetical protein